MYITFDEIMDYKMKVNRLQAENVRLKNGFGHGVLVELEQVDALKDEVEELKAEIKSYIKAREGRINTIDELKADIKEKEKQYHLLAASKSSHYPKEYRQEAEEYFSNNPKAKYVAFYMLSEYDIRDGEGGDLMLYKDDAIAIIDNDN